MSDSMSSQEPIATPVIVQVDSALQSLMTDFMQNRRGDVEKFRAALAAGDFTTLRAEAHGLKGTGGAYGFDDMSRYAGEIEKGALEQDQLRCATNIEALAAHVAVVQIQYV